MSDTTTATQEPRTPLDRTYTAIATTSKYLTFFAIVTMMVVMVVEVFMRYLVAQPLGWNISLIENVLMPGLVFLGLPYAYAVGAHVAAELVYDRLGPTVEACAGLVCPRPADLVFHTADLCGHTNHSHLVYSR